MRLTNMEQDSWFIFIHAQNAIPNLENMCDKKMESSVTSCFKKTERVNLENQLESDFLPLRFYILALHITIALTRNKKLISRG